MLLLRLIIARSYSLMITTTPDDDEVEANLFPLSLFDHIMFLFMFLFCCWCCRRCRCGYITFAIMIQLSDGVDSFQYVVAHRPMAKAEEMEKAKTTGKNENKPEKNDFVSTFFFFFFQFSSRFLLRPCAVWLCEA